MKRFVCECLNILNFLFIRVFAKFDMDTCFMRGVNKYSNYKACYQKTPEWKLQFQTERLSRHCIVKGRHLGSKSRINSFLGRSFVTVKMPACSSFLLKLAGWFQNE